MQGRMAIYLRARESWLNCMLRKKARLLLSCVLYLFRHFLPRTHRSFMKMLILMDFLTPQTEKWEFSRFQPKKKNGFLAMNPIFYKIDDNTLGVGPGVFDLANTVVIPKGQILSVSSGTTLRFSPGVSFFSYGKILARSSSGNSIRFVKSGKDPWGVFALIEAPGTSVFDGVVFEDGGTGLINGAYFSGMLAAHHSDIIVRNSFFKGATGDDSLNVKHASSSIVSNQFTANQFDAIDLDWGNFSFVKDNVFEQNGDDAIDLGGAQGVVIMDNFIKKSGDKCISIGEKSVRPLIINNILSGCKIGVQVKDGSDPIIANNII